MKSYRHIIALVFLALFCIIELADIHMLSHDTADDTDCQICLLSSEKQNDGFIGTQVIEVPCIIVIPADIVRSNYEQNYFDSQINYSLQNKAPPTA
ncbi:hypothetical protein [Aquimarina mytili]|uniref:Uncharacterized protein n=1 Tax=Aquimarina mytili TaxID=874423 RepID=A0A936ZTT7_9FLAO|nr:hypothetical protein [Aquimarina mytili]MBL0685439.1 hypothetical protein [Aquimarina mytili]